MGMFDYIRVDSSLVPPRPTYVSKRQYQSEIDEITGDNCQTKDLSCTLDNYEIAADGRLLVASLSRDRREMSPHSSSELTDSAIPCTDRLDCGWVIGFSGEITPGQMITFVIKDGRVVSSAFKPFYPPAPKTRLQRAEQMARHFGTRNRRGKKWANVSRRITKKMVSRKFLIIDEAWQYMDDGLVNHMADLVRLVRHQSRHAVVVSQTSING